MRKIKQEEKIESIEVTKEAQINDEVILEAGDRVKVLKKEGRQPSVFDLLYDAPERIIGLPYSAIDDFDWYGFYPVVDKRTKRIRFIADAEGGTDDAIEVYDDSGNVSTLIDKEAVTFEGEAYWI